MDKAYPPEAWRRLGSALEARRGQLGYGFRQREGFLADHGGAPPSVKTLARLERGERASYPPATITRLESMYEVAPGSFEAFLEAVTAGGDAELPWAGSRPAPLLPSVAAETAASPEEAVLVDLLARYQDSEVIQAIGTQGRRDHWPAWAIAQGVLRWLERQGDGAPAEEVVTELVRDYKGNDAVEAMARQRGKPASMVAAEILEFVSFRPPEMEAGNGTAG
jgi:hypothetical protein